MEEKGGAERIFLFFFTCTLLHYAFAISLVVVKVKFGL